MIRREDRLPFAAILMLALLLRLASAAVPMFHHPDEIWQYLEPAYGSVTGDRVVTWEWRAGMRGWLVPTMLTGPVLLGRALPAASDGPFLLARLLTALLSVAIVAAAMAIGLRRSRRHAIVAGLVTATAFELLYFGPRLLSDTIAAALFLPAYALLERPGARRDIAAGVLLALCFAVRFQLVVPIAILVFAAAWGRARRLPAIAAGVAAGLVLAGLCDAAHGAVPFRWIVRNMTLNLVEQRSAHYGVRPAWWYLTNQVAVWGWGTLAVVPLIALGARRAPLLLVIALATIAVHALVPHKEYRFVFLSTAILIVLAALGSAELLGRIGRGGRRLRGAGIAGLLLGWAGISAATAMSPGGADQWKSYRKVVGKMAAIRAAGPTCGVAFFMPETEGPPAAYSLLATAPRLELFRDGAALRRNGASYDVLVSPPATVLPPGFARRDCMTGRLASTDFCIAVRRDRVCAPADPADEINRALARQGE